MNNKTFVTIFPPAENIHLIKEIGMIPYLMFKNHKYESYVASYDNGPYPYLENELKGLKMTFIERKSKSEFLNILLYIIENLGKIDAIQFIHFSLSKLFLIFIFKMLKNRNAKSYIKLDANQFLKDKSYHGLKKLIVRFLMKYVDFISAETKEISNYLNTVDFFGKDVAYIPNGILRRTDKDESIEKINQIITVGRLDDPIKSISTQVEAFKLYIENHPDSTWIFKLVGAYDTDFENYFIKTVQQNPFLNDKLFLEGPVYDREKLYQYYKESKLFLMSSLSESFGFVYLEALYHNCFVISTPILSAFEITNYGEFGDFYEFNDSENLAVLIDRNVTEYENKSIHSRSYILREYDWNTIVEKIYNGIEINTRNNFNKRMI